MIDNQKILSDLKEHLNQDYNGPINEIVLFGSHARGESTKDSDYDILIVLDNDYSQRMKMSYWICAMTLI